LVNAGLLKQTKSHHHTGKRRNWLYLRRSGHAVAAGQLDKQPGMV
jgi:hypothetical protein